MEKPPFRPICDFWWLARSKRVRTPDGPEGGISLWGMYPAGFLERARVLVGASLQEPVLHACAGAVRHYPYRRGFGPNDRTLDLDPVWEPDFLQDARDPWPLYYRNTVIMGYKVHDELYWSAILIDPPYTEEDALHYAPETQGKLPGPGVLLRRAWEVLAPGGRVGLLHYLCPQPPKGGVFIASVAVLVGFNNRIRVFSVFEKPCGEESDAKEASAGEQ